MAPFTEDKTMSMIYFAQEFATVRDVATFQFFYNSEDGILMPSLEGRDFLGWHKGRPVWAVLDCRDPEVVWVYATLLED